jgi:hypothetical protein
MTLDLLSSGSPTIISTHAFQDLHSTRPASREDVNSTNNAEEPGKDIFDIIIPRPVTATANDHQAHGYGNETTSLSNQSFSLSGSNHFKQFSLSSSGPISDAPSVEDDEETSFGNLPAVLRSERNHTGATSESSPPSPEQRSHRSSSRARVIVPARRSSRARGESRGSNNDILEHDAQDSRGPPEVTTAEIEAARRVLAAANIVAQRPSQRPRKPSMQTDRSATPPPIGRARRRDGSESGSGDTPRSLKPTISDTTALYQEAPELLPASRRHSQASVMSHKSRKSSRTQSHQETSQKPVLEHTQSSRRVDSLLTATRASSIAELQKDQYRDSARISKHGSSSQRHYSLRNDEYPGPTYGSLTAASARHPAPAARRMFSDDALYNPSKFPADRRSIVSRSSSSRLPDFFSYEIFQLALRNPATAHQLLKYSETRLCSENIEFLNKVG